MVRKRRPCRGTALIVGLTFAQTIALAEPLRGAQDEPASPTTARADTLRDFLTHDQFVRRGVIQAAETLFASFTFSRSEPLWITPAEEQAPNFWVEEAVMRTLFDRGFVIRETMAEEAARSRTWAVRYRTDRFRLTLSQSARHSFLGKIWVKRVFDVALHVHVWDLESGELLWSNSAETRLSDWIPKRRLPQLSQPSSPFLSPAPPVTTLERLAEPPVIVAAAAALTVFLFAVR